MSSPASSSRCACPGSGLISATEVYVGTGGSRLPSYGLEGSCRLSLRPPRFAKVPAAFAPSDLFTGPFLVDARRRSPPLFSLFPDEPGRGLKPRRRQYLVRYKETRYRPIYYCRSKRLRGEDVVPIGLASATTPQSLSCGAACLPAPRMDVWGWCSRRRRWWRRESPVHSSAVYVIRNRRPPGPCFRAAPGPLSS